MKTLCWWLCWAGVIVLPLSMASLWSQTTSSRVADAPPADSETVQLMTYTVSAENNSGYYSSSVLTGTRAQTSLSDLPMTVNVVTSELMADLGAVKLEEALQYTPAVSKGSDFESNLTLRGFRETTPRFNGFPTLNTSRWDSATIDRVEVLKGPSAAIYGSTASAGGFVNVITKKPLFKDRRTLTVSAATTERYRASLDLTGPLEFGKGPATFAYRIIGVVQEGSNNGWRDFADGRRRVISPSLTWRPSSQTEVTLELYRDRYDRVMDVATQPLKGADQSRLFFNELSPEFNINGPGSFDNYFMDGAFLYVTHQINPRWSVRAISAYLNTGQDFLRRQGFTEVAATPGVISTFGLNRHLGADRLWHRADVQWKETTHWGKFSVLLGLQYYDDSTRQTNLQDTTEPRFPLFSYTRSNYEFRPISAYTVTQGLDADSRGWLVNGLISYALFEENLTLFSNYARRLSGENRSINYFAGQSEGTVPWEKVEDPDDYQVGVTFKLTPGINLYGMFGRDVRLNSTDNSGVRLPNVEADMVEAGFKFNLGSRVNGGLAFFDITHANLARRDFSQPSQPLTASGTERSRGAELELYWRPVDGLDIVFGYAYLDAKITANPERPDLVGSPLQDAPENAASVWSRYKFAQGAFKGLSVGLGVVYRDEMNPFGSQTAQRRAFAVAPKAAILNAMLRYVIPLEQGREVSTQLSLNNLTDEKYFSGTDYGAPFTAEAIVTYRF